MLQIDHDRDKLTIKKKFSIKHSFLISASVTFSGDYYRGFRWIGHSRRYQELMSAFSCVYHLIYSSFLLLWSKFQLRIEAQ